jgi:hypothetical protein
MENPLHVRFDMHGLGEYVHGFSNELLVITNIINFLKKFNQNDKEFHSL